MCFLRLYCPLLVIVENTVGVFQFTNNCTYMVSQLLKIHCYDICIYISVYIYDIVILYLFNDTCIVIQFSYKIQLIQLI